MHDSTGDLFIYDTAIQINNCTTCDVTAIIENILLMFPLKAHNFLESQQHDCIDFTFFIVMQDFEVF